MSKYTIGLGYGNGEGRAVLINTATGECVATAVKEYTHGILNDGFEHPMDYLEVVTDTIPRLIAASAVSGEDIIGISVSFPAGTILPVLKDGTPLCFFNEFKDRPEAHARVSAYGTCTDEIKKFSDIASERSEAFLSRYGGKAGSSLMIPAIMKTAEDAPEVYDTCDYFIEASDWISWQLTGRQTRSASLAGFYGTWSRKEGYPSKDFLSVLSPKLKNLESTKLDCPVSAPGTKAGYISAFVARNTGLSPETVVAVGTGSLQACMAGAGITEEGKALAELDRTTKFVLISSEEVFVPGISAMAEDGIYPGYAGYKADNAEAAAVLNRFRKNFADADYITERALSEAPGKNAMVSADGVLAGITLKTTQESILKALLESSVFSVKRMLAGFSAHGIGVDDFYITGNPDDFEPRLVKLYADILNMPIKAVYDRDLAARGAAVFAALAAGADAGGYASIKDAAANMGEAPKETYLPDESNAEIYKKLFDEQTRLLDYFGGGANDCLKRLKNLAPSEDGEESAGDDESFVFESELEEVPTLASEFGITEDDNDFDRIIAEAVSEIEKTAFTEDIDLDDDFDLSDIPEASEDSGESGSEQVPSEDSYESDSEQVPSGTSDEESTGDHSEAYDEEEDAGTDSYDRSIYEFSEDDVTDEIRENAEKNANEIFRIVDEVVEVVNDAELHAIFDDLIREEAERETDEILKSVDEVARIDEEAAHMAVFGSLIEEEAEKNTAELLAAIDDVVGTLNDAELNATEKYDDIYDDFIIEEPIIITAADIESKKFWDLE